MVINKHAAKRYAIYVFYDKDGIADEYNFYLLEDLKKNVDRLLVICNGDINTQGLSRFEAIADEVVVRENEGFDITAYKLGLQKHGFEYLNDYDEVVLLNATNYGPFYPFEEMFDVMNTKDVDFWGITVFDGAPFDPFGTIEYHYIPKHIQSHFMVFRRSLHQSADFIQYFDEFPEITTYEEAVGKFEAVFTKKFEEKGYKWAAYADEPELTGYTFSPHRDFPKFLIEEKHCPILKRRSFFHEYQEALERTCGEATLEAFTFIEENLDYDTNMIWENLLRLENQADIKKRMHLNYILPTKLLQNENEQFGKIALILHIYHVDMAEYCLHYIESMPENADIYVTVPNQEKKEIVETAFKNLKCHKMEVLIVENRGRDVSALLVGCRNIVMQYDYVCFIHDKKVEQIKPHTIGESWGYMCYENLLASKVFVRNVLNTFKNNEKLGMLSPPPPCHSQYYPTIGAFEWGPNFDETKRLAKKLNLHVNLDPKKEPIAPAGSCFWFRPKALKDLFEYPWEYTDFPEEPLEVNGTISHAIERIHPFVAQNNGYYPGNILSDEFARIELTNLDYINETLKEALFEKYGKQSHLSLKQNII